MALSITSNESFQQNSQNYSDAFESESESDEVESELEEKDSSEEEEEEDVHLQAFLNDVDSAHPTETSMYGDVDVSMDFTVSSSKSARVCYSDEEESSAGEMDNMNGRQMVVPESSPYGRLLEQHRKQVFAANSPSPSHQNTDTQRFSLHNLSTPAKTKLWQEPSPQSSNYTLESKRFSTSPSTPHTSSQPDWNLNTPVANADSVRTTSSRKHQSTPSSSITPEQKWLEFTSSVEKSSPMHMSDSHDAKSYVSDGKITSEEEFNCKKDDVELPSIRMPYSDEDDVNSSAESSPLKVKSNSIRHNHFDNSHDFHTHSPVDTRSLQNLSIQKGLSSPIVENNPNSNINPSLIEFNSTSQMLQSPTVAGSFSSPSSFVGVVPNASPHVASNTLASSNLTSSPLPDQNLSGVGRLSPFTPSSVAPTSTPPLPMPYQGNTRFRSGSQSPMTMMSERQNFDGVKSFYTENKLSTSVADSTTNVEVSQIEHFSRTDTPSSNPPLTSPLIENKIDKSGDSAFASKHLEGDDNQINSQQNEAATSSQHSIIPPPVLPYPSHSPNLIARKQFSTPTSSPQVSLRRVAVTNASIQKENAFNVEGLSIETLEEDARNNSKSPAQFAVKSPQFHTPLPFAPDSPLNLTEFCDTVDRSSADSSNSSAYESPHVLAKVQPDNMFGDNYHPVQQEDAIHSTVISDASNVHTEDFAFHSAPLPYPWVEYVSEEGYPYYYNTETEESSWDHPALLAGGENDTESEYPYDHESYVNISSFENQVEKVSVEEQCESTASNLSSGKGNHSPLHRSGSTSSSSSRLLAEPLNHLNKSGQSALHISASVCNEQALSLLLSTGADPDVLDGQGHSPLQVICRVTPCTQQAACISTLLSHDVDCNRCDCETGNTPLHSILLWGMNFELLSLCPNSFECPGLSHMTSEEAIQIRQCQLECVSVLVSDTRVDISCENADGDQALHLAVKLGLLDCMQVIIQSQNKASSEVAQKSYTSSSLNPVAHTVPKQLSPNKPSNQGDFTDTSRSQTKVSTNMSSALSTGSNSSATSSKQRRNQRKSHEPEKHQQFWGNMMHNESKLKKSMYSSSEDEDGIVKSEVYEGHDWDSVSSRGSKGSKAGSAPRRRRSRASSYTSSDMKPISNQMKFTPERRNEDGDWKTVDSVKKSKNILTDTIRQEASDGISTAVKLDDISKPDLVSLYEVDSNLSPHVESPSSQNETDNATDLKLSSISHVDDVNSDNGTPIDETNVNAEDDSVDSEIEALGVLRNGWVEYCTEEGDYYYYNSNNGNVQWKHPFQLEVDRKAAKLEARRFKKLAEKNKSSENLSYSNHAPPVTEQLDEFYDATDTEVVISHGQIQPINDNFSNVEDIYKKISPTSYASGSNKQGGMRTLTVEVNTSPRNVVTESIPSHEVAYENQSDRFNQKRGTLDNSGQVISNNTGGNVEVIEEVFTQGFHEDSSDINKIGDAYESVFQYPASLSTATPSETPVYNTVGGYDFNTPTKTNPLSTTTQLKGALVTTGEHNYRVDRAPSVSSLSDMTVESVRTEQTNEKHMEVWSRFFENAIMASSSVDSDSNRRVGKGKDRKPYVSVSGFTPVSNKKKHRTTEQSHAWAIPPATAQYKDMINATFALREELNKVGENSNRGYSLQKKVAAVSSETVLAAAMRGDIETMETLLLAGFSPSCVDKQIRGPLHHACRAGDTNMVELLNDYGVDLDATDITGQTALHVACQAGRGAVIQCLLQCAADTDIKDNQGNSALHIVSAKGDLEGCRILLEYGASPDSHNIDGRTPLDVAMQALSAHRGSKPPLGVRKVVAALTTAHSTAFNSHMSTSNPTSPISLAAHKGFSDLNISNSVDQERADRMASHILVDAYVDEEYSVTSGTVGGENEESINFDDSVSMDSQRSQTSGSVKRSSSRRSHEKSESSRERARRRKEKMRSRDGDRKLESSSSHIHHLKERARRARSSNDSVENVRHHRSRDRKVRGREVEEQAQEWKEKGRLSGRGIPLHSSRSSPLQDVDGNVSAFISDDSNGEDEVVGMSNDNKHIHRDFQNTVSIDTSLHDTLLRDAKANNMLESNFSPTQQVEHFQAKLSSSSNDDEDDDDSSNSSSFSSGVNLWGAATSLIGATMQIFSTSPTQQTKEPEKPPLDPFAPPPTDSELLHLGIGFQFDKDTVPQSPRPPSIVEDDLKYAHQEAYRSGSTPRRNRPTAPDEVVVAVEMARAAERHRRTPKVSVQHGSASSKRQESKVKRPAPLNLGRGMNNSVNGYSMVRDGSVPTGVSSRYVDILNDPNNKL